MNPEIAWPAATQANIAPTSPEHKKSERENDYTIFWALTKFLPPNVTYLVDIRREQGNTTEFPQKMY